MRVGVAKPDGDFQQVPFYCRGCPQGVPVLPYPCVGATLIADGALQTARCVSNVDVILRRCCHIGR